MFLIQLTGTPHSPSNITMPQVHTRPGIYPIPAHFSSTFHVHVQGIHCTDWVPMPPNTLTRGEHPSNPSTGVPITPQDHQLMSKSLYIQTGSRIVLHLGPLDVRVRGTHCTDWVPMPTDTLTRGEHPPNPSIGVPITPQDHYLLPKSPCLPPGGQTILIQGTHPQYGLGAHGHRQCYPWGTPPKPIHRGPNHTSGPLGTIKVSLLASWKPYYAQFRPCTCARTGHPLYGLGAHALPVGNTPQTHP